MSACFIVEYAGAPMHFHCAGKYSETTTENKASRFTSEADAWYAAYHASLNPAHVRVVDFYARQIAAAASKPN